MNELTAAEAARRIAAGSLTSEALVRACLDRIAARDKAVKAWAFVDWELALSQARVLDRSPRRSALHGVPFGIKDVIDTADQPTEYNSPIWRGYRPKADAACVAQLKSAGCVILGKTVTTEFANNHPSQTLNPHNPEHTPGGSSSGSAAAVADAMVPLALGTQTGGSVIRPAAYCGATAIKPSFGSINRAGLKMLSEALDTIGIFSRSAEDLGLALSLFTGRTMSTAGSQKPRVGLCRTPRWNDADKATQANLEAAAERLAKAGARMRAVDLPEDSVDLFDKHKHVMAYETARSLAWEYQNHNDLLSSTLRKRLDEGWKISRSEYDAMRETARRCRRALAAQMKDFDFLLTPSAPSAAPASLASTGDPVFNRAWTLFGVPCVTLPWGSDRGLPLAVQLVGAQESDMALIAWAQWTEKALAGH